MKQKKYSTGKKSMNNVLARNDYVEQMRCIMLRFRKIEELVLLLLHIIIEFNCFYFL